MMRFPIIYVRLHNPVEGNERETEECTFRRKGGLWQSGNRDAKKRRVGERESELRGGGEERYIFNRNGLRKAPRCRKGRDAREG